MTVKTTPMLRQKWTTIQMYCSVWLLERAQMTRPRTATMCVYPLPEIVILEPPIIELYPRFRTLQLMIRTKKRKRKRTKTMKTKTTHP
jgi:hypothetical protein